MPLQRYTYTSVRFMPLYARFLTQNNLLLLVSAPIAIAHFPMIRLSISSRFEGRGSPLVRVASSVCRLSSGGNVFPTQRNLLPT